jgi:hypothetical protein
VGFPWQLPRASSGRLLTKPLQQHELTTCFLSFLLTSLFVAAGTPDRRGSPEDAMCKSLPFTHFYGLVIVPVLAVMLAFPASAQISSGSQTRDSQTGTESETESTGVILINIDKSKQKMTVSLDGVERYVWPVSTGRAGYSTPSGNYTATSMNEIWYSKEWDNAPMPHSIFFRKDGYAIHGTYEAKNLGRPASHGCVRISRENAATLFALVKKIGLKNTEVVLNGVTPGGEYTVANDPDYPPVIYFYSGR